MCHLSHSPFYFVRQSSSCKEMVNVCGFRLKRTNVSIYNSFYNPLIMFCFVLDLSNCQRWMSIRYNHTHHMYTRRMLNIVDLEKNGHIDLGYNGSTLRGFSRCSIIKDGSAYLNSEGQWKSVSVEEKKFAVAFEKKNGLTTLQVSFEISYKECTNNRSTGRNLSQQVVIVFSEPCRHSVLSFRVTDYRTRVKEKIAIHWFSLYTKRYKCNHWYSKINFRHLSLN